jgi:two-component system cell cycle response regulator
MHRVLIVDDNRASRDLLRAILKPLRCELIEAAEGQEALDQIQEKRPDLVLLDIDMPVLDGLSVLRRIRQDPRLPGLPVIAVTAYAMDGDREKGLAEGFTAYLTKPVQAAAVRQQVEDLLKTAASKEGKHGAEPCQCDSD